MEFTSFYRVLPSGDIVSLTEAPEGGTQVRRTRGDMTIWTCTFEHAAEAGLAVSEMFMVDLGTITE